VKAGETAGYPRFQGANRYASLTSKQFGNGATLDHGCLELSKLGRLAVRWSRPLAGTPKTVTSSREAAGWYVCFSCAEVPVEPLPLTGCATGSDLGLESVAPRADGSQLAHPCLFRVAALNVKRAQRRVSQRKKGSNRRRKARKLLAKAHQTVRRVRADFQYKTALALVRQHDTMSHEELPVANRVRNHALAKSISDADAGLGTLWCHPRLPGSLCREASRRRAACLYLASLFRLRRHRQERLVRSLAHVPELWHKPTSRP